MLKDVLRNFVTTLTGAFAGGPMIKQGIDTHNYSLVIAGIATFLLGIFAKDANK